MLVILLSFALGLLLGLLGGGGSVLAVPVFRYGLGEKPSTAIPGALVVVALTSLVGLVMHARRGRVRWRCGFGFAAVSLPGAIIGGWFGSLVPDELRMLLFAGVLVFFGIRLLRVRASTGLETTTGSRFVVTAAAIGALTGFLGVGGGVLITSSLVVFMGVGVGEAAATALLVIVINASGGLLAQIGHTTMPWDKLLLVAAIAAPGAVLGARIGERLPRPWLKTAISLVILALAGWVLWREWSGTW